MTKNDVYQEVTDRISAALEAGTVPWHKPWKSNGAGMPVNIRSGRPYRGINVLLLGLAGYSDPRWGTFKAVKEAGGSVRKGEKGTRVILWKPVKNSDEEKSDYLLLRQYVVFNAQQCDGLPALETVENEHTPNERAEEIVREYIERGPSLFHGYDAASYSPPQDVVRMPNAEAFDTPDDYYCTLFHELTHSTGHESRLGRIEPALFGTDPYAREELVAEMGAAFLCGLSGIEAAGTDNSAAYIASWLRRLQDDRKLVIQAAAQAQKAVDLIAPVAAPAQDEAEAVAA